MRHVFQLYNSTILRLSYWNEIGYTTQKDRYFRERLGSFEAILSITKNKVY